ncbi:AUX/IAA protein [Macleaya cordata]|uniref:Auxin-responsive protein n=1 Tax=Macleaya cordata TaxID=56857 RepID=A0A200R1L2_MACCD|nr:AUX/IAA protein [Macleaya cordata]
MGRASDSSSSSIDSSSHPPASVSSASSSYSKRDLSTDLRLGLSLSSSSPQYHHDYNSREEASDWPPIKPLLRSALADKKKGNKNNNNNEPTLYVKVYMEGIPIGRKLDIFTVHGYDGLLRTLAHMFKTTILLHSDHQDHHHHHHHVLTYEDKEGDWMMVGDVPWDMFLTTVKRLKITRSDQC